MTLQKTVKENHRHLNEKIYQKAKAYSLVRKGVACLLVTTPTRCLPTFTSLLLITL